MTGRIQLMGRRWAFVSREFRHRWTQIDTDTSLPRAGRQRHAGVIVLQDLWTGLAFERLAAGAPLAQAHAVAMPTATDLHRFAPVDDRELRAVETAARQQLPQL